MRFSFWKTFSLPKLQYILGCAPCCRSQLLQRYDSSIRNTLNTYWTQNWLKRPGIKRLYRNWNSVSDWCCPSCLLASSSQLTLKLLPPRFQSLSGINNHLFLDAVSEWQTRSSQGQLPQLISKQTAWDMPLVGIAKDRVLSAALTQAGIARLNAASAPYSGAFLQALPCSATGTRLDDTSLRIAIATRLGAPVSASHTCICGATVDSSATHGLSCRKSAGRVMRHTKRLDRWQPLKSHPDSSQLRSPDQMVSAQMDCRWCCGNTVDVWYGTSHALTRWRKVI